MVLVPVELRVVSSLDGVFNGERMQSEGDGDVAERSDVRVVELDPQQGVPGTGFGQASVEVLDDLCVRLMNQSATAHVSAMMPVPTPSELARLMIEHGVGVTVRQTYELKRVDEDYFAATIS